VVYTSGLEPAMKAAKTIVVFLTQRLVTRYLHIHNSDKPSLLGLERERPPRILTKPSTAPFLIT